MAGYQFIREECYAKVRGQGAPTGIAGKARDAGGGKLSARDVIAEAIREIGAAPHVNAPAPPVCLHGESAADLMTWYDQVEACAADQRSTTKTGVEKRQRSDVPILMGVVASYPGKADEGDEMYVAWRAQTLFFLKQRYGDHLASVLEHTDEEHGHIHAIVANRGKSVKSLHAGFSAMQKAASEGEPKKLQSIAYQTGGRALQDAFFDQVASRVGLARLGPKKPRLTRRAWLAQQQANEAIARAHLSAQAAQKRVEAAKIAVREDAQKVDQRSRLVRAQEARVQAAEVAVRAQIPKIAAAEAARKNEAIERQKRVDAEKKIVDITSKNERLEGDLNTANNELRSLRRKLNNSSGPGMG